MALRRHPARHPFRSGARRACWHHSRRDERAAGSGLRANRRHAGRHWALHPAAAAGGVRGARLFALPGGGGGFSDGRHHRGQTVTDCTCRQRALCSAGWDGSSVDGRMPDAGAVVRARLPGRLPFADGAGRLSHRRRLPGRHCNARRDAGSSGHLQPDG